MSGSVHTSPTALLNPEIVDEAFGISLLSGVDAELLRYFMFTSGNGGHLLFTTHLDIGECSH